ncbi:MAG TPA: hypothetical protein V6C81_15895 [Planktothrix sp.]
MARQLDGKKWFLALSASLALVAVSGQSARCADQPPQPGDNSAATPAYGQPAGSLLDQSAPAYGQSLPPSVLDQTQQQLNPQSQGAPALQQPPISQTQPASPPQPSSIDLTSAVLSHFEMDLDGAQFQNAAVDKLHVLVNNLDMKNGTLSGLGITVKGGQFQDMAFDQLNITTQGTMNFDRNQLVNDRALVFQEPVPAQVMAVVSQESLNRFLNSPGTLDRLSVTAAQKVHFLAGLLGSNANIGVSLSDAEVALEKGNRVNVGVKAKLGMGGVGVPLPLSIDTKLGLNNGWIALSDTHLESNGQEISPLLSEMIVKKFNELTEFQKNGDITFSFSELKVVPNKQFVVKGTAQIARLHFGQKMM